MTSRITWHHLPAVVQEAIEWHTGPVVQARSMSHGLNCTVAASLTSPAGRTFIKGVRLDDQAGGAQHQWEVDLNPYVAAVCPRLLWRVAVGGWDVLGFEFVEGRHADLSPGSPDLPLVAEALRLAGELERPPHLALPRFADRWADHLDHADLDLLLGDALLHTDTNPHNILVGAGRAYLIDWATPARGPAWVDVAHTAVRLMEDDCPPAQARAWAAAFPCWTTADRDALRAFVRANCRSLTAAVGETGARESNARFAALLR
ncbi:phosphotransferase [Streptomyces sp. SAJ15]|uniref:phosphotransferase n=1 Tax=Streptomyces sp. SAJ15 TaxID=2011095 RepID=UPI0021B2B347|nr:phosphotransferase [Streptomyces sp. SAJ15]